MMLQIMARMQEARYCKIYAINMSIKCGMECLAKLRILELIVVKGTQRFTLCYPSTCSKMNVIVVLLKLSNMY